MIPKTINIMGIVHTIEIVDKIDHEPLMFANIVYEDHLIRIKKSLDEQQRLNSLMHEIMHVILWKIGKNDLNEEEFVEPLANAIYDTLTRNGMVK